MKIKDLGNFFLFKELNCIILIQAFLKFFLSVIGSLRHIDKTEQEVPEKAQCTRSDDDIHKNAV